MLRDAKLPLDRFTLIVGPNGSGKSTALTALQAIAHPQLFNFDQLVSADLRNTIETVVRVEATFAPPLGITLIREWKDSRSENGHSSARIFFAEDDFN
ncbi:MAG: ATP-binding protein, partial [Blastocatellia bacterium]